MFNKGLFIKEQMKLTALFQYIKFQIKFGHLLAQLILNNLVGTFLEDPHVFIL